MPGSRGHAQPSNGSRRASGHKSEGGGGGAGSGGGADVWVEEGVEFYEGHCWEGGRGLAVLSILFTHLASQPYVDRRPR